MTTKPDQRPSGDCLGNRPPAPIGRYIRLQSTFGIAELFQASGFRAASIVQAEFACLTDIALLPIPCRNCSCLAVSGSDQANRAISTSQLNALLHLHLWPIDVVVFHGSQGRPCFEGGFPLRCLQRLSCPNIATQHYRWHDNWSTSGSFNPVLSY